MQFHSIFFSCHPPQHAHLQPQEFQKMQILETLPLNLPSYVALLSLESSGSSNGNLLEKQNLRPAPDFQNQKLLMFIKTPK